MGSVMKHAISSSVRIVISVSSGTCARTSFQHTGVTTIYVAIVVKVVVMVKFTVKVTVQGVGKVTVQGVGKVTVQDVGKARGGVSIASSVGLNSNLAAVALAAVDGAVLNRSIWAHRGRFRWGLWIMNRLGFSSD